MAKKPQRNLTSIQKLEKRIFQALDYPTSKEYSAYTLTLLIVFAIVSSALIAILETESVLLLKYSLTFRIIEVISFLVFILEYVLRLWTSEINPEYKKIKNKQLKYVISPLGIIDLVCVISLILSFIIPFENAWRNFTRLLRLIVFFKSIRYFEAIDVIWDVVKRKKEELIMTFLFSLILLFISSFFILIAEHEAQPDKFTNLFSAMYWAGITMFTIGYGDIYPVTPMGKIIAAIVAFLGITLFLLPSSVITAGFIDEIQERYPHYDYCPNCNKEFVESKSLKDLRKSRKFKKILEQEQTNETKIETRELDTYKRIQLKIFDLLENKYPTALTPKLLSFLYLIFIGFIAFTIMIESNPKLSQEFRPQLIAIYIISAIVFTIEYAARLWICPLCGQEKYPDNIYGRVNYARRPFAIIDLIVLLTFYLQLFFSLAFGIEIMFFIILRLLVIFKIGHLTDMFNLFWNVFKEYFKEFLTSLFLCFLFLIYCSTIMFSIEHDAQPDKFSNIITTLWWGIITFTTVGYGDVYAVTTPGHFFTILFAFAGVALFTLPAGILGASFFSSMKKYRLHKVCPKCGYILSKPKFQQKT
jgi:voltage-gated potassium channel